MYVKRIYLVSRAMYLYVLLYSVAYFLHLFPKKAISGGLLPTSSPKSLQSDIIRLELFLSWIIYLSVPIFSIYLRVSVSYSETTSHPSKQISHTPLMVYPVEVSIKLDSFLPNRFHYYFRYFIQFIVWSQCLLSVNMPRSQNFFKDLHFLIVSLFCNNLLGGTNISAGYNPSGSVTVLKCHSFVLFQEVNYTSQHIEKNYEHFVILLN